MQTRRTFLKLAAATAFSGALSPAEAGQPFSADAFKAAQDEGRPVLIAVAAPWCPICRTQKPILAKLAQDPRFARLAVFEIDFDTQKDLLRRFDARQQSTLIAFKGSTEVGRSVGETQPEWIESLLEKTL
ncbi:thioredoxin family protein [Methylobacterium durans]|uniref:Thiol reductase thioredoxin n=1 Tax=Methylobacterium durans TaxID=2202825 RepID=A0A2U8W0M5_9HYPH|nr:thioredoxin family protein [Methylobacterium durans]AWN39643.1 thiol reductase thioredoxin [Methylobacterium durans]MEA1830907.1 thioredoxin family protein [Methylobacterium durans]